MLREQASITVDAMDALVAWSSGDATAAVAVRECEHRADETKRQLWRALRDAFSPPLDAEDLYTLSADLDEVLNAAKDLTREMELMDIAPDAPTHEMVVLLAEAVRHLAGAFESLAGEGDATALADAAIKGQRRVEHSYRTAMSALLQVANLREVMGRREAYRRLSRIGDLIHTVAERVWYAVVKESKRNRPRRRHIASSSMLWYDADVADRPRRRDEVRPGRLTGGTFCGLVRYSLIVGRSPSRGRVPALPA